MKTISKLFLISMLTIGYSINIFAQSSHILTKDEAWEIVKKKVLKNDTGNINVYVSNKIIRANSQIETLYSKENSPAYNSWFFFIDDKPFSSWSHPCRYVFININNGKSLILNKAIPPDLESMESLIKQKVYAKGKTFDFSKYQRKDKNVGSSENDYAVIINGGVDVSNNWIRYWNHCAAIYSALVNIYGYADDHIYVLVSDGTNSANDRHYYDENGNEIFDSSPLDLDNDGDNDIQYAATKANITQVFNTLQNILTPDDNLFIYTTDHGGQESGQDVTLGLWDETMRDDEFAAEVDKVNAGIINICMVQCHSGGFIDDLQGSNRIITTSCKYDEYASAIPPDYLYSEFTYHWISAIAGETPEGNIVDADSNNDGFVTLKEAFSYAKNHDTQPSETPQYNSTPSSLGNYTTLNGQFPYISGPTSICTQGTYRIKKMPTGATVQWYCSGNVNISSGQSTGTAVFSKTGDGMASIFAVVTCQGRNITLPTLQVNVGIPLRPYIRSGTSTKTTSSVSYSLVYGSPTTSLQLLYVDQYGSSLSSNYITQITSGSDNFELIDNGTYVIINPTSIGTGSLTVRSENQCGISSSYTTICLTIKNSNTGGGHIIDPPSLPTEFTISPNPASDYLTVTMAANETKDANMKSYSLGTTYIVQLWNASGMIKEVQSSNQSIDIPISNLTTGTYYIRVICDGQVSSLIFVKL